MTATLALTERHPIATFCESGALSTIAFAAFALPLSVSATTASYLLAWVLILCSGQWRKRWQRIQLNFSALSFWILFFLFLIGLLYTVSPWSLAFHDLQKRHWLLITPFLIMTLTDDVWRTRVINGFLLATSITLFFSFLKFFGLDLFFPIIGKSFHGTGVFYEHIVQTFFFSLAAFIAGYRFFYYKKWRPLYFGLYLLLTLNVLFMADSGTGYILFSLQFIYLGIVRFGWRGAGIFGLFALLMLVFAYNINASTLKKRTQNIASNYAAYQTGQTITSIGLRIAMWHNALLLIKEHPLLGYGTGGIRTAMTEHLSETNIQKTQLLDYVENIFLNVMLQFGLLGLFVFFIAITTQLITCFYLPHEYRHLMLTFLLIYLVGGLANSFFVSFCEAHLYSLIAAVCFSAYAPRKTQGFSDEKNSKSNSY